MIEEEEIKKLKKEKAVKGRFADRLSGRILLAIPKNLLPLSIIIVVGSFVFMFYLIYSEQSLHDFIDLNFGAQTEIDFTKIKVHPFYLKM